MLEVKFPIPLRPEVIEALVNIANTAMLSQSSGATPEEVLSAYFSMTKGAIAFALNRGVSPDAFREPIAKLYAMLPPLEGSKH